MCYGFFPMRFRFFGFVSAIGFSLAVSGCGGSKPAAGADHGGRAKQVDALFAKWDKPDAPGAAVAVIHHGKIIYERGFGSANLEYGIPIKTETVFHVASVSAAIVRRVGNVAPVRPSRRLKPPLSLAVPDRSIRGMTPSLSLLL